MFELLFAAAHGHRAESDGYSFRLDGDLQQMSAQRAFLRSRGFDVRQNDVYPSLKPADTNAAIGEIFAARVAGWWHYRQELVAMGACTEEDFNGALDVQCARSREAGR